MKLVLEGFQSGLSWLTILRKREHFRRAFRGFVPERVARFGARDVERLLGDAGIVRHRGKIEAAIHKASTVRAVQRELGSFATYVWSFAPSPRAMRAPRTRAAVPATTDASRGARRRPPSARLPLRRSDDGLCVHAGDGSRERPPDRLRQPVACVEARRTFRMPSR